MLFIRSLLACFMLININSGVSTDWKLRREESGVKIYTRNIAGSPFEEFRGVVTI